jgi:hypothetical protein
MRTCICRCVFLLSLLSLNGCTVIAIADAAVSTTVKVGSAVVGTAVDVTRAGVRAVTSDSEEDSDANKDSDSSDADSNSNSKHHR